MNKFIFAETEEGATLFIICASRSSVRFHIYIKVVSRKLQIQKPAMEMKDENIHEN